MAHHLVWFVITIITFMIKFRPQLEEQDGVLIMDLSCAFTNKSFCKYTPAKAEDWDFGADDVHKSLIQLSSTAIDGSLSSPAINLTSDICIRFDYKLRGKWDVSVHLLQTDMSTGLTRELFADTMGADWRRGCHRCEVRKCDALRFHSKRAASKCDCPIRNNHRPQCPMSILIAGHRRPLNVVTISIMNQFAPILNRQTCCKVIANRMCSRPRPALHCQTHARTRLRLSFLRLNNYHRGQAAP